MSSTNTLTPLIITANTVATNQYDCYRVVSASLEVLNTSNYTTKAGVAYGACMKTKADSSNVLSTSQTIFPLSIATSMGIPNQCRAVSTFSQIPNVVATSNQEKGLNILWYPLDEDCIAFNEPNTVEGGVAVTGVYNANTLFYLFDNTGSATAQQLVFSICANYEVVSSSVSITYGSDARASSSSIGPMQTVSMLGSRLIGREIMVFSDAHPASLTSQWKKKKKVRPAPSA